MILLYFVFFLTAVSCHESEKWKAIKNGSKFLPPGLRIIGGDEVKPHSYPFQVGLLINKNAFCGGTLISSNYVLTAAHCGEVIREVDVILGAHNITEDESTQVIIQGKTIIVHENYNSTSYENDIALIQLETSAPLNEVIGLAPLPSRNDVNNTYFAETVSSTGWGLTSDVSHNPTIRDISDVLRVVNVTILNFYDCGDYYFGYIKRTNLCTTGYKNKGTCNGDSGGPLLHENIQIGIVSFGTDLCEECSPSVYTNVGKYLDWIEKNSDVNIDS